MKALKQAILTFTFSLLTVLLVVAGYNTAQYQIAKFDSNEFGIKLAKRLDEIKGEVTIGRLAASVPKMDSAKIIKKQVNKIFNPPVKTTVEEQLPTDENANLPAPVISDDLELSLTGGLFNKKPLDGDSEFSGSAKVVDGVVEEITVSLPDGDGFVINTNERMVGNVFQYEDTKTRELKSGLFYKVKPGVFMVTLTNDSQYPGLRLEFKTDENVDVAQKSPVDKNWQLDNQNDNVGDHYSQAQEVEAPASEQKEPEDMPVQAFGFNFQS